MKTLVISLGGSVMIPDKVNYSYLKKFRGILRKNYSSYKFVVVCGGGGIARKYISALKEIHKNKKQLAIAGIRATRMNALFLMQFFGKEANDFLPLDMKSVKDSLTKNNVVICGSLRFADSSTSDATAAKLASLLKTSFVNITNVKGLYSKDPHFNKDAKFISEISSADFNKLLKKVKFEPGQHFVLDQIAAKIILDNKIPASIIGPSPKSLKRLLKGKSFTGTIIK